MVNKLGKNNQLAISDLIQKEIILSENQLESLIQHMRLNVTKQKNTNNYEKKSLDKRQNPVY